LAQSFCFGTSKWISIQDGLVLTRVIEVDVDANESDFRRIMFRYQRKYLNFLGVAFAVIGIPLITRIGLALFSNLVSGSIPIMIFTIAPPFCIVLMIVLIVRNIRKQAANLAETTERTKFSFTNEGVDTASPSTSTSVAWSKFRKIQETSTDFIFFPQTNLFYSVPKRFFDDDGQIAELRVLISEMASGELDLLNK
jgi:hypothetical protein